MRYDVTKETSEDIVYYTLTDHEKKTEAKIVPALGNNLFSFRAFDYAFITFPYSLSKLQEHPVFFQYGIPILFPPNRVKNSTFSFNGRQYQLPVNEDPHHLHGELCSKAWEVVDYGADEQNGAFLTSVFRFADHPEIKSYFPHDMAFELTYVIKNGQLELKGTIENQGEEEAPFAFGFHPYFQVEVSENVEMVVPAEVEWPVNNQAFVQGKPRPTQLSEALNKGVSMQELDDLDCWMVTVHTASPSSILYHDRGLRLDYQLDETFPYMIIFKPDWDDAVSFEPYSYVTDAFNLPYDPEETGARGLKAQESITFHWKMVPDKL